MTHQPFVLKDVPGPRRDMVGYGRHGPRARWPNDARVAIHSAHCRADPTARHGR